MTKKDKKIISKWFVRKRKIEQVVRFCRWKSNRIANI